MNAFEPMTEKRWIPTSILSEIPDKRSSYGPHGVDLGTHWCECFNVGLNENTGPPSLRGHIHGLPCNVVSFVRISIDIPHDSHGCRGRSHSLWYCYAKVVGAYRWFGTTFMFCPLRRISSAHNPFALDPEESACEALSTISGTELGYGISNCVVLYGNRQGQ